MAARTLTCIKADRVPAGWSPSKYFGCGGIGLPQGIGYGSASDFALVHIEPILQVHIVNQRPREPVCTEN
jgi:hypothetical protein